MTQILNVSGLTFRHSSKKRWLKKPEVFSLGPIDMQVTKGETIAIIGQNRSGKSLLAKMLAGAVEPDEGHIQLQEERYWSVKHRVARKKADITGIRMIFQHNSESINPGITVGQILDEPLRLNSSMAEDERKALIGDTLVKVGLLREHIYFYRHMLSDGQQQRVSLAKAILPDPKVLIADEPFAALDPTIRSQTVNLILQLQKEMGLAFIFISHNLGIVRHIADRVIVMDKGQIIESGKTETIFRWPQHELTKKLVMSYQSLIPQQTMRRPD
jgi:cationic peptide transport system ATP-binding protein